MLDLLFRITMYSLFFLSIAFLSYQLIKPNIRYMKKRYERIHNHDSIQKLILKVKNFLELSIGKDSLFLTYVFIFGIFIIFFATFIGLILNGHNIVIAILFPIIIIGMVYYLLVLLAYRNRVLISHEGLVMVQELINNYKIYNHNIYEAIDKTANSLTVEQAPLSKKMLNSLSYRLRHARNEKMVKEVLNQMFYVMDVSWAYSLSIVIEKAVVEGLNIEDSLKDIASDLEELENLKQMLNDEIHEAKVMLIGVTPLMFGLTLYILTTGMGFTLRDFLIYQFGVGFMYLLVMLAMYLCTLGFYLYVKKPKNDF